MAKGYVQQHDIDYDETSTPIAKMMIVRVLLAMATAKGCHLHQMDVKNTLSCLSTPDRCVSRVGIIGVLD